MIRAVLFDLDGTLYDRDASLRQLTNDLFETFRSDLAGVARDSFIERSIELDAHGHGRAPRLYHRLGQELGFGAGVADRLEARFSSTYPSYCRTPSDTLDTLHALRAHGKKLGVITNGPVEWQRRKLHALELASWFDSILISEAEGIEKPDPRIFRRGVEQCGTEVSQAMFVGDHPEADVAGAGAAGLLPVWKRVPYWAVPPEVLQVGRLKEILPFCLP
jgi:putative hydrolase of the HAD superfamily